MTELTDLRKKHPCPFYGFYMSLRRGVMADQSGNQCALITDSYAPCTREMDGEAPDWANCLFNLEPNAAALEELARTVAVFPKVSSSPEPNKGIPLKDWKTKFLGE